LQTLRLENGRERPDRCPVATGHRTAARQTKNATAVKNIIQSREKNDCDALTRFSPWLSTTPEQRSQHKKPRNKKEQTEKPIFQSDFFSVQRLHGFRQVVTHIQSRQTVEL